MATESSLITNAYNRWTNAERSKIYDLLAESKSVEEIANLLGRSTGAVSQEWMRICEKKELVKMEPNEGGPSITAKPTPDVSEENESESSGSSMPYEIGGVGKPGDEHWEISIFFDEYAQCGEAMKIIIQDYYNDNFENGVDCCILSSRTIDGRYAIHFIGGSDWDEVGMLPEDDRGPFGGAFINFWPFQDRGGASSPTIRRRPL